MHCHVYHAVPIAPVSRARLHKTGIFQTNARDYRRFRPEIAHCRDQRLNQKRRSAHIYRPFYRLQARYLQLSGWLAGDAVLIAPVSRQPNGRRWSSLCIESRNVPMSLGRHYGRTKGTCRDRIKQNPVRKSRPGKLAAVLTRASYGGASASLDLLRSIDSRKKTNGPQPAARL